VRSSVATYSVMTNLPLPRTKPSICITGVPSGAAALHGHWILTELRRHGYEISPGTLYPLLERMERRGWLKCRPDARPGGRGRKNYSLTPLGRKVLALVREQIEELYREVVAGEGDPKP